MEPVFDHLVIGAATLDAGGQWATRILSRDIPYGGAHPAMGTHNRVAALSDESFLEIIAVDPEAEAPGRARWFGLDDPAQQTRLTAGPKPISWVVATDDLDATLKQAKVAGVDLGRAVTVSRGSLSWRIAVRDDGALLEGGTVPLVIEWPSGPHPAARMPDVGVRLAGLTAHHPEPNRLLSLLTAIGADSLIHVAASGAGTAWLSADINLPSGGTVCLSGR